MSKEECAKQEIKAPPKSVWIVVQDDPRATTLVIDDVPRILCHGHHNLTWLLPASRTPAVSVEGERLAERHWELFSVIRQEYDYESAKAEAKRAYLAGFQARSHLVELLKEVLNSDMAMREEDEGRESKLLQKIRAALKIES